MLAVHSSLYCFSQASAVRSSQDVMTSCLWVREAGCGYAEVVEGV